MRNFDIIKDIDGLKTLYSYCRTAEDFQTVEPRISAQNARLALETMVKTVYRLKGWTIDQRDSLFTLTTDERFTAFIDSEELMRRIHYVRKIGNIAAHAATDGGHVGRRESFFALLNLYYVVGSVVLAWRLIDSLPDFDKALIPDGSQGQMAVVPQQTEVGTITDTAAETAAKAVEDVSGVTPEKVEAQPIVNDLSEEETRRLYIDLREFGIRNVRKSPVALSFRCLQAMPPACCRRSNMPSMRNRCS